MNNEHDKDQNQIWILESAFYGEVMRISNNISKGYFLDSTEFFNCLLLSNKLINVLINSEIDIKETLSEFKTDIILNVLEQFFIERPNELNLKYGEEVVQIVFSELIKYKAVSDSLLGDISIVKAFSTLYVILIKNNKTIIFPNRMKFKEHYYNNIKKLFH